MDALALRLAGDCERLNALAARSGERIRVLRTPSATRPSAQIELRYFTAGTTAYPNQRRDTTGLVIDFAARYPFAAPVARLTTPIVHPNVWESGIVCLGSKWLASEGIDLYVHRIARLITFDPLLVNEQSAANRSALVWYQQARRQHPQAFPSDQVPMIEERAATTTVVTCSKCQTKLRLPNGKSGIVACPRCGHEFEART